LNLYNARAFGSSFPLRQNNGWLSLAASIVLRKHFELTFTRPFSIGNNVPLSQFPGCHVMLGFKPFKTFKPFKPTSFLLRDAGKDQGGGSRRLEHWNETISPYRGNACNRCGNVRCLILVLKGSRDSTGFSEQRLSDEGWIF
jgi:hypothetical protein